jgi:hypothetical protein
MTLAGLQLLLERQRWTFAHTLVHVCRHYYTLRSDWAVDADFTEAVRHIRLYGHKVHFPEPDGPTYTVCDLGQWRYWCMRGTRLINRRPLRDVQDEDRRN